jgi:Heterokaryon incompatibility protein (HET)
MNPDSFPVDKMSKSPLKEFTYQPLPTKPDGPIIRLIELLPGPSNQTIACKMVHTSLDNPPHYEALSYTWVHEGRIWIPNTPTAIVCNDTHLNIPKSLETALRHLRDPREPRSIWADAICIHQTNEVEKTHQVSLMRDIYRKATRVVIWLGPASMNGPGELALDLVPYLAAASKEPATAVEVLHQSADIRLLDHFATQIYASHGIQGEPREAFNTIYTAFFELLEMPWFARTWIVQEAAVASDALLLHGTRSVSWADFLDAFAFSLKQPSLMTIMNPGKLEYALGLLTVCQAVKQGSEQRLFDLLLQHRNCGASDSKDKVFALCGLARDAGADGLDVKTDYRLDTADVYRDLAIKILKQSADLALLSVSHPSTSSRVAGLPSWVPDWSLSSHSTSFRARDFSGDYLFPSKASKDTIPDPKFSSDGRLLAVNGMVVDHITKVGSLHDADTESSFLTKIPKEQTILNDWEHVSGARSWSKYLTGESMMDVYWQTLVGGCPARKHEELRGQFHDFDRTTKRFRMLHWVGLQKYRKTYIAASYVMLSISAMSDGFRRRLTSPLSGGYATWGFAARMAMAVRQRRMIRTQKGFVGLASGEAMIGDSVVLFQGGHVPVLLRWMGTHWQLVGDAYLHGIMNGEAFNLDECQMIAIA